ncbi:MAG: hypothetical protein Kow00122_12810 [Thermoleophilia bacterium]
MESRKTLILIVDDEPDVRNFLADLLTAQGYDCATAASGLDALEQVERLTPDLVLLDIMMPGMSGLDVLKTVRRQAGPQPAVIMLSCLGHPNTTLRALREGADQFVVKPFRVTQLLETLGQVLNRTGAE